VEFDNSFEVPVPVDQAWTLLMDIERIAPCVPGAELTEVVDERNYKGKISVKLGPVALTFNGQATFEEIDDAAQVARLAAKGSDTKGRGGAQAKVSFGLEPCETGSRVLIHTDLMLSGAVAQYGRGVGMVKDLAQHIISQFAANLEKNVIGAQPAPAPEAGEAAPGEAAPPPQPAAPMQVGGLGLKVLWAAILRGIKGLFGIR